MAFSKDGLNLVAGSKAGNAPQIWTYKSNDLGTDIDGSGYFNTVAGLLKVGDLMYIHSDADSTPIFGLAVVASNTGTVVDITSLTTVGGTNSD
jgi:hypothetical protein